MIISSRTPEGRPNQCPVCESAIRIEPSRPLGDAPCPCCGHLLWFINVGDDQRFFDGEGDPSYRELVAGLQEDLDSLRSDLHDLDERRREQVIGLLKLLVSREQVRHEYENGNLSFLDELGMDSLEIADLVMEYEQDFDSD